LPLITIIIGIGIGGRIYFQNHQTENPILLSISGVRGQDINAVDFDPSGGRAELIQNSIKIVNSNFIGLGIQKIGVSGIESPQGAPGMWFLLLGYPGISLFFLMIFFLFKSFNYHLDKNINIRYLFCAFCVLLVQQTAYGTWLNPNYIFLVSIILDGINRRQTTLNYF
jgi:hypothetical protein